MPKILVNIDEIIFKFAKELFYEKGYEHVSMRDISEKSGIAVGTLYNYYSNKKELYISVLEKSWEDTFEKLDIILKKEMDEKKRLKSSIKTIYYEILDRKCMGIQVRKTKSLKDEKAIIDLEKKIKLNLKQVFKNIEIKEEFKDDANILGKIVYTLLINTTMLMDYYPNDREENVEYLYSTITGFIK